MTLTTPASIAREALERIRAGNPFDPEPCELAAQALESMRRLEDEHMSAEGEELKQ